MSFTKRNIIGQWFFHVFLVDGKEVQIECSSNEYKKFQADGVAPQYPNGKHFQSYGADKYDSLSGFLEEGDYTDETNRNLAKENGLVLFLAKGSIDSNGVKLN